MNLIKRTYTLPEEVIIPFEEAVNRGGRSALLASLIHEWLEKRRLAELRSRVIEGCREMGAEYLEQERAYHRAEEEANRGS